MKFNFKEFVFIVANNFAASIKSTKKYLLYAGYMILFYFFISFSLKDITNDTWASQVQTYQLPINGIYKDLSHLEEGLVVEIPFFHYPYDVFEKNYIYNFNRSLYKFRLLNAIMPQHNQYYEGYRYLYDALLNPNIESLQLLEELGVKYIVLNEGADKWDKFKHNENLEVLKENKDKVLLLLKNAHSLDSEIILNKIQGLGVADLKKGDKVLFNNSQGSAFIKSGFSASETWGTWTHANEAIISFKTNVQDAKFLELKFNIFSDGKYQQNIAFFLNGLELDTSTTFDAKIHTIKLPISNQIKEVNELLIKIPTAISPKMLNMSEDNRLLGLGLISLELI